MCNEGNSNLNVILGQLEDELRAIKSARELADGVVSANSELSTKLERVVVGTKDLIEKTNDQTRAAAEALTDEIDRISEQTDAIKKVASESSEAIMRQSGDAQATLTKTTSSVAETLSVEAKRLTEHLQAMEESSSRIAAVIQAQASDAQAALGQTADDVVERTSIQMSGFIEIAMSRMNEEIDESRASMSASVESVKAAAMEIDSNSNALLEANEASASENKHQNAETRAILEMAQTHLDKIESSIATLKKIDINTLIEEVRALKAIETSNAAFLKSKLITVTAMAGASIVLCIVVLAKLFIG